MKEWKSFLSSLENTLGKEAVLKWMPKCTHFDAANIYLEAEDSFQVSWFEEHVEHRLKNLVNQNGRRIKVHLAKKKREKEIEKPSPSLSFLPDPIDPEMSFSNFVPSQKTGIVIDILKELTSFNPIFLFGPRQSGKTHLLMATAHLLKAQGKRVFYAHAQTFTDHVVQAIRLGQMQEFRKNYREIDALIIDNVDLFSKKWATQEEFFHTFNHLHTMGKPILLSAALAPAMLHEIEPRLMSRFEWGISLELNKTDPYQIISKKAELWQFSINDETKAFIAKEFRDPVIPLQALLLRAKNIPVTIALAQRLLKDFLEKEKEKSLTEDKIIKQVAAHFGVTKEDLLGKSQMKSISEPRKIAMYYCRTLLKLPLQKIGALFSRDHSTVISSVKFVEKNLAEKKLDPIEFLYQ